MPENQNGGRASVLWCSMLLRCIKAKLVKWQSKPQYNNANLSCQSTVSLPHCPHHQSMKRHSEKPSELTLDQFQSWSKVCIHFPWFLHALMFLWMREQQMTLSQKNIHEGWFSTEVKGLLKYWSERAHYWFEQVWSYLELFQVPRSKYKQLLVSLKFMAQLWWNRKLSCLATMSSNMFGGEALTQENKLLSSMVLVVICCGAVWLL